MSKPPRRLESSVTPVVFAAIALLVASGCGKREESAPAADTGAQSSPVAQAATPAAAVAETPAAEPAPKPAATAKAVISAPRPRGNWPSWRGPLQTGVSLEQYQEMSFDPKPAWTYEVSGRGTPVIFEGQVYAFGYRIRSNEDVREYLSALDEDSGELIWENEYIEFMSDTVYNRYAVGSPCVDVETKNVYHLLSNGTFSCFSREGELLWEHSLMERFGRLSFPNGRAGAPVVEGDLVIVRGVTSYWGKQGPARDRFLAFDKRSGDLVWTSTPGVGPPFLKDSSFSTPFFETRGGRRVFYVGLGCGNVACISADSGEPLWRYQAAKGGINSSPVVHGGDKLIYINDKVNVH
ncbi:MAG: PQQ-binding-like beta-propeller repeat protein, partial [Verrucomicrobiales bacterium]